jgi:DNA ligase-1
MLYSDIVKAYKKVESTSKRLEMTSLLVELLKNTPKESIEKIVYLTQGKLYPDFIGIELGIAEKLAIKAISIVTGKSEKKVNKEYQQLGDLGHVAENLLKNKTQQSLVHHPLTINIVYDSFENIAKVTGPGSIDVKVRYLTRLLNDASPIEAKYLIRTSLGKLRLGVADMTIIDALAEALGGGKIDRELIERSYNLSSDLGLVAKTLAYKGLKGIKQIKILIGKPIRPMLAERLSTSEEILEKVHGKGVAEYKYDGIRIQAHLSSDEISLFSRRLENITTQFPDVCQYLRESLQKTEVIVEGECIAIEPNTGDILPFQIISQRRGRKYHIDKMKEDIPVKVILFDLLYIKGQDYTLHTYLERRKMLESIVASSENVELSHQLVIKSPDELDKFMDQAISEGCEGIIIKSIGTNSIYKAGARGWLWIKYKRSYKVQVVDTFDLVIVGAFKGRGKRAGYYGAILVAVYNKERDIFETICKLGSGFTDEDLANTPSLIEAFKMERKHPRVKSLIKPDVWFIPEIVVEVAADEITLSPSHMCGRDVIKKDTGFALRFPRFTGNFRKDKGPEDATTTKEIIELYKIQLKQIA